MMAMKAELNKLIDFIFENYIYLHTVILNAINYIYQIIYTKALENPIQIF